MMQKLEEHANLKDRWKSCVKVKFLGNFLQDAFSEIIDYLIIGLASSAAGRARLHLQNSAHQVVCLLSLCKT
jgi:hypothetical protein